MAWFYESNGTRIGPISSAVLKQLASSGVLQPKATVWKDGVEVGVPAHKIKGLFETTPTIPAHVATASEISAPPAIPANRTQEDVDPLAFLSPVVVPDEAAPSNPNSTEKKKPVDVPQWLCAAMLLFCFPIGLICVWANDNWSNGRKWVWTGGWLVLVLFGFALDKTSNIHRPSARERRPVRQLTVDEVKELWSPGKLMGVNETGVADYLGPGKSTKWKPNKGLVEEGDFHQMEYENGDDPILVTFKNNKTWLITTKWTPDPNAFRNSLSPKDRLQFDTDLEALEKMRHDHIMNNR